MADLVDASWRKSTRSNNNASCLEVADNLTGIVAIRDSKDQTGPVLIFTPTAFARFTTAIKHGQFDRP